MKESPKPEPWYAVRCLFMHPSRATEGNGNLYEERVTLWHCASEKEAFEKAETEAKAYEAEGCIFIKATDSFHLFDEFINDGTEVWSIMRGSFLNAELYEETFCNTSQDRKKDLQE